MTRRDWEEVKRKENNWYRKSLAIQIQITRLSLPSFSGLASGYSRAAKIDRPADPSDHEIIDENEKQEDEAITL